MSLCVGLLVLYLLSRSSHGFTHIRHLRTNLTTTLATRKREHWIETCEIIYYNTYVDDIFGTNRTNENTITNYINAIHQKLEFKLTEEDNRTINYLDVRIITWL